MAARKERHACDGLRKRCGCPRSKWPKCDHSWYFNFQIKRKGISVRRDLDELMELLQAQPSGHRTNGKTEAEANVERLRTAFRNGDLVATVMPWLDANGTPVLGPNGQPRQRVNISTPRRPARQIVTLEQLLAAYVKEHVTPNRPRSLENVSYQVGVICTTVLELPTGQPLPFGEWLVVDVGTGALEKFRAARRIQSIVSVTDPDGQKRSRRKGGVQTSNRDLSLLRATFNWGIRLDYVETTPFKKASVPVVKISRELSRRRRLEGDEGERLLKACDPLLLNPKTKAPLFDQPPPRLRPIVEAALETGCRRGELLSLQWWQVKDLAGPNPQLDLPAAKTKTKRDRVVPISSRLKAILEMRRHDPAGEPHGPQAYVFGNEIGQRSRSIKTAWRLACRRAKIVDLHFHDLRREAGSRWLEGGVPLQVVRDWLGHTNISQTSTYLESTFMGQHDAMRRFEARARQDVLSTSALVQAGATDGRSQLEIDPPTAERVTKNPNETVN